MVNELQKLAIGSTGFITSAVTPSLIDQITIPVHDWTSALTQLIIAVVTVFSLFKRKKK